MDTALGVLVVNNPDEEPFETDVGTDEVDSDPSELLEPFCFSALLGDILLKKADWKPVVPDVTPIDFAPGSNFCNWKKYHYM